MGVWKHEVKSGFRVKVNEQAEIKEMRIKMRNQVINIQTRMDNSKMEVTGVSSKLFRSSLFFTVKHPSIAGISCLHGRETAVFQALPGICDFAPKPEEGIWQFCISEVAWEMAVFSVGAAVGCATQRLGGILGER